jgi:hypothetical protein
MPTHPLTRAECERVIRAVDDAIKAGYKIHGGMPSAIGHVARSMGMDRRKLEHRIQAGQERYGIGLHLQMQRKALGSSDMLKQRTAAETKPAAPTLPDFPSDDIPAEQIIDMMCSRFERRAEHKASKQWFRIAMPDNEPFAIWWWGDPHLDSNGCDWPLLRQHAALAQTPRVYSINLGDTLDNWPHASRLIRLYAHSDTSVETARKLARWFLRDAGIQWLLWLLGNHDSWGGHTSPDWLREVGGPGLTMEDWGAKFVLACPNGAEFRIHAAHDFPGHSMWNPTHGAQRKAYMGEVADIYACGHRHNWAMHREEHAERGHVYSIIRARGYKALDDHADKLGFITQRHGASVVSVFDPATRRHYSFEHPEDALLFFEALQRRAA